MKNQSNEIILTEKAAAIRTLAKTVAHDVVEIGRHLTEAKEAAGHGNWLPWLKREFGWSERTAQNFMRAFELTKSANFADLETLDLDVSSLYLLAAKSTPEPARAEVAARIRAGDTLSREQVCSIVSTSAPSERRVGLSIQDCGAPSFQYAPAEVITSRELYNTNFERNIRELDRMKIEFKNYPDIVAGLSVARLAFEKHLEPQAAPPLKVVRH